MSTQPPELQVIGRLMLQVLQVANSVRDQLMREESANGAQGASEVISALVAWQDKAEFREPARTEGERRYCIHGTSLESPCALCLRGE